MAIVKHKIFVLVIREFLKLVRSQTTQAGKYWIHWNYLGVSICLLAFLLASVLMCYVRSSHKVESNIALMQNLQFVYLHFVIIAPIP